MPFVLRLYESLHYSGEKEKKSLALLAEGCRVSEYLCADDKNCEFSRLHSLGAIEVKSLIHH